MCACRKTIEYVRRNAKRKNPPTPETKSDKGKAWRIANINTNADHLESYVYFVHGGIEVWLLVTARGVTDMTSKCGCVVYQSMALARGWVGGKSSISPTLQVPLPLPLSVLGVDTGSDLSCAATSAAEPTELLLFKAASSFLNCSIS
jgi:hypothetical protein